jgi:hypothetical protein
MQGSLAGLHVARPRHGENGSKVDGDSRLPVVSDMTFTATTAGTARMPYIQATAAAHAPATASKVDQWFGDGRRQVKFANGTIKYVLPDGLTMVQFVNGDVKKQLPSGTVEYYYKEVDTWHSTLASGIEVCASRDSAL